MNTSTFDTKSTLRMQDVKNMQNNHLNDLKNNANVKNKTDGKIAAESIVLQPIQQKNESDRMR